MRLEIRRWFLTTGASKSHKVRLRWSQTGFVTQGAGGPEDVKSHCGLVQVGMSQA